MNTLTAEFFDWLVDEFGFTAGENAFMNMLPDTNQVAGSAMWLIDNSAVVTRQFVSHSKMKQYTLLLNYRHTKAGVVNNKILEMEQVINHTDCFNLPSYKVIKMQASSWTADRDADNEQFYRGSITVTLDVLDTY